MADEKLTFGQCPFNPTGDACHSNCELFVMTEGCCAFRLIAYKLAGLNTSLTLIANIFELESQ